MSAGDPQEINAFLIEEMEDSPTNIVQRAVSHFGITRQAVLKRLNGLIEQGDVEAFGRNRGRTYRLRENIVLDAVIPVKGLEEDIVYGQQVRPALGDVPDNVQRICAYGFTEMLNNVIDHSNSDIAIIRVSRTPSVVDLTVMDRGVGIFKKIKEALGLENEQQSLIELSKGKMTTDQVHHSGQGVFFTSRIFDRFSIISGNLYFWHRKNHDDWLTSQPPTPQSGTYVRMRISLHSTTRIKDIFDQYSTPEDEYGFTRTHVPLQLAQFAAEDLVSRSQAKRVLARFDQFDEVLLDFANVESIGQAFADEIFRVFRRAHPAIRIHWINDNPEVASMIQRAINQLIRESNSGPA